MKTLEEWKKARKREYLKQYYIQNREKIRECNRKWYAENRDSACECSRKWYDSLTPEERLRKNELARKRWANLTPEQRLNINRRRLRRHNERIQNDSQYKLQCRVRGRLHSAIKNNQKSGSAVRDLGCTIPEFKQYIESRFQPGMTWFNYGRNGWHLDHKIPLASFNLSDRDQFKAAFHYTNYQPLWASENLSKHDNTTVFNEFFYEPIENNSL